MFFYIWNLIIDIIENSLFATVAFNFFVIKPARTKMSVFLKIVTTLTLIEYLLNIFVPIPTITVTIGLLMRLFIIFLYFEINWTKSIFISVLFTILCMFAENIAILPTNFLNIDFAELLQKGITRYLFTLFYILILSIFSFVLISFKNKIFILNKKERISFFIISFTTIIIEQLLMANLSIVAVSDFMYPITIIIYFLVMVLYWGIVFYIYTLGVVRNKNLLLEKERLTVMLEQKQYEKLIESSKELRGLRHDFKHHTSSLISYLNANEYEKASDYIKSIDNSIDNTLFLLSSGNIAVDSIVSYEFNNAKNFNIELSHSIYIPDILPVSDPDICSILSNLLDNAIENCSKQFSKRFIDFTIKPFNDMLSIVVSNSSTGEYKYDASYNLLSTKPDNNQLKLHGIGLNRVTDIVNKYKGIIEIEPQENIFTVRILLPY